MNIESWIFFLVSAVLLVLIPSILFARKNKKDADKNKDGFVTIVEWLDHMELMGVTLLSKLVVFFATVPVAIQTQKHAETYLEIDGIGSWILAFVVEALGYAAAYRLLQFIQYNKNLEAQRQVKIVSLKGAEKKQALEKLKIARKKSNAPVTGPAVVYGFYIVTVIGFNVLPEVFGKESEWWKVLMWVFIALLSIPAAYLGAVNAIHTEQKEAGKRQRTNSPAPQPANEQQTNPPANEHRTSRRTNSGQRTNGQRTNGQIPQPANERTNEPEGERPLGFPQNERRENILAYVEQVKTNENRTPGPSEIARELGVSKGYASDVMNGKA